MTGLFWRKRRRELAILVGLAMIFLALSCQALSRGGTEPADAAGTLGEALTATGAATANPVLLGAGVMVSGVATWLRLRAGAGSGPKPPTAPPGRPPSA